MTLMDWNQPVIVALAASLAPTLGAVLVYLVQRKTDRNLRNLRVEVNGKMADLLQAVRLKAMAEGELKGAEDERKRTKDEEWT